MIQCRLKFQPCTVSTATSNAQNGTDNGYNTYKKYTERAWALVEERYETGYDLLLDDRSITSGSMRPSPMHQTHQPYLKTTTLLKERFLVTPVSKGTALCHSGSSPKDQQTPKSKALKLAKAISSNWKARQRGKTKTLDDSNSGKRRENRKQGKFVKAN